jgi:hypothetical protein
MSSNVISNTGDRLGKLLGSFSLGDSNSYVKGSVLGYPDVARYDWPNV